MLITVLCRVSTITDSLSHELIILSKWFYNNFMVRKPDTWSFMSLGADNSLQTNLVCDDEIANNTKQKKLLGVALDNKLDINIY